MIDLSRYREGRKTYCWFRHVDVDEDELTWMILKLKMAIEIRI